MSTTTQKDPFRYTPGNGYVYTWDGGPYIEIWEIFSGWDADGNHHRSERRSPDVIPAPATARTASALMDAVDQYRGEHDQW